jgi:hypothetical protein
MFPTQVSEWRSEERAGSGPIGGGSSFDVQSHPIAEHLKALAKLRAEHPALSTGATVVKRAEGTGLAIGRTDFAAKREYVAAFNSSATSTVRMTMPVRTPSATWRVLLGTGSVAPGTSNLVTITVPPLSTLLVLAEGAMPVVAPRRPQLRIAPDEFTDFFAVESVNVGGTVAAVTFAVKRARGRWTRLAVDDAPAYRAFLDPRRYRRGERLHLVAVARGLDGRTAVSRVTPFVVPRRAS